MEFILTSYPNSFIGTVILSSYRIIRLINSMITLDFRPYINKPPIYDCTGAKIRQKRVIPQIPVFKL